MGQYTCDECHEIPKIISTNIEKKTILLKCKNHGQKELNLRDYIVNSLKYNPNNWKCTKCENIQKTTKGLFKFCDCGFAFCDNCIKVHKKEHPDSRNIIYIVKNKTILEQNIQAIVLIVMIIFVKHVKKIIKIILKYKIVIWK